jgi:FkbM family methyltransferase
LRQNHSVFEYETREGVRFRLRRGLSDSLVILENWWLNEYFRKVKRVNSELVVIDIGAHIGSFSLLAATKLNARVFAFEPDPKNFRLFLENIRANNLEDKITAFNLAVVGKKRRKVRINLDIVNPGENSVFPSKKGRGGGWIETETISLEAVFRKNKITHCDFLKADCEGSEYEIFEFSPESIWKKVDQLVMEYHEGGDIQNIKQRLEKTGFTVRLERGVSIPIFGRLTNVPLLRAWQKG